MISDNLAEAATQYASQGWHVFPCSARSKLPTAGTRGFHDATDSVDDVVAIWRERPTLNVAVALGASGLLAVDIETSEHEWLERLPETWTQRTPGGGWHFLYRQPAGTPIPSVPLGQLAGDVEIKGDGGYVLLAPSRAASKKLGNAVGAYSVAHEVPPQDAPQWLVDMVRARESQRRRAAASVFSSVRVGGGAEDRIAGLLADLRAAPDGGRNHRLISVSASVGRVVAGGFLSASDAEARLQAAVAPWGNPRKDHACIRRGLAHGQTQAPWYPDESPISPEDDARIAKMIAEELTKGAAPEDSGAARAAETHDEARDSVKVARTSDDVQRDIYARVRALGGLCDTFTAWQARGAIRHQPFFFVLSTVALGSTLAARQYVYRGSTSSLYMLIVGDTSAGKSRPQECLAEALAAADVGLRGPGNMVSSKALWKVLADAARAGHGVCYILDEFGELLGTLTSSRRTPTQADLYSWILRFFSTGQKSEVWGASVTDGGKADVVKAPALSMFGGTTPVSLFSAVKGKQAADGFLGRLLVGLAQEERPTKRRDAWRESPEVPGEVLAGITAIWQRVKARARDVPIGEAGKIEPEAHRVQETPGAAAKLIAWDDAKEADEKGAARDMHSRALEMAQRVALSLAVLRTPDRDPVVDEDVADVATEIVDFCLSSLARVVEDHSAENETERAYKEVMRVCRDLLGDGRPVPLRAVSRRLRHLRSKDLHDYLARGMDEHLWIYGDARTEDERKAGGHKKMHVMAWKEGVAA